jgi:hypothetical protein
MTDSDNRRGDPATKAVLEEQRRLHEAASRYVGVIEGTDPDRAATARRRVRER